MTRILALAALSAALAVPTAANPVGKVPVIKSKVGGPHAAASGSSLGPGVLQNNLFATSATTLDGGVLPSAAAPEVVVPENAAVSAVLPSALSAPGVNAGAVSVPKGAPQDGAAVPAVGSEALRREMQRQGRGAQAVQAASQDGGSLSDALDVSRTLFDGDGARDPFSIQNVVRTGEDRGGTYFVDGIETPRAGAGQFKILLEVPGVDDYLLALFENMGAQDVIGSRQERDRELRKRGPLATIGVTPKEGSIVRVRMQRPNHDEGIIAGFYVEKVFGHELWKLGQDDLRAVRAMFDELIAHRIYWGAEPTAEKPNGLDPKLVENIMLGTTLSNPNRRAWIVDADSRTDPPKWGRIARLMGEPDPLVAYYLRLYKEMRRQWVASSPQRLNWLAKQDSE